MSPREGLHEIPTCPLEDVASDQIDPPGRFGLRVSNERQHAPLRSEARNDMDVVGEDRDLVHVHVRSEEHTSELQSPMYLVCRLLLEKKKNKKNTHEHTKT